MATFDDDYEALADQLKLNKPATPQPALPGETVDIYKVRRGVEDQVAGHNAQVDTYRAQQQAKREQAAKEKAQREAESAIRENARISSSALADTTRELNPNVDDSLPKKAQVAQGEQADAEATVEETKRQAGKRTWFGLPFISQPTEEAKAAETQLPEVESKAKAAADKVTALTAAQQAKQADLERVKQVHAKDQALADQLDATVYQRNQAKLREAGVIDEPVAPSTAAASPAPVAAPAASATTKQGQTTSTPSAFQPQPLALNPAAPTTSASPTPSSAPDQPDPVAALPKDTKQWTPENKQTWKGLTVDQKRQFATGIQAQAEERGNVQRGQREQTEAASTASPWTVLGDAIKGTFAPVMKGLSTLPTGVLGGAAAIERAAGGDPIYGTEAAAKGISDFWDEAIPEPIRGTVGDTLGQGLGSAMSFIPGGAAGALVRGSRLAVPAISAVSGAVTNGGQAYLEARDMGLDDQQSFERFALNAGIGTSEALGVGRVFSKLDRFTRGGVAKFLAELGKEGIEEGAQETFQSAASDVADLFVLKDGDPRKKSFDKIRDDAIEAGVWGATIGLLFGGVVSGAQRHAYGRQIAQNDEQIAQAGERVAATAPAARYADIAERVNAADAVTGLPSTLPPATPEIVQQAAEMDGATPTSEVATARARVDETSAKLADLRANQSFSNPADLEEVNAAQAEHHQALTELAGAQDAHAAALGGEGQAVPVPFQRSLTMAREAARFSSEVPRQANGDPDNVSQRTIAQTIARIASGVPATAADLKLRSSEGGLIFHQDKATGRITMQNAVTQAALQKEAPTIAAAWNEYETRPIPGTAPEGPTEAPQGEEAPAGEGNPPSESAGVAGGGKAGRWRLTIRRPDGSPVRTVDFEATDERAARLLVDDGQVPGLNLQAGEKFDATTDLEQVAKPVTGKAATEKPAAPAGDERFAPQPERTDANSIAEDPAPLATDAPLAARKERARVMWANAKPGDVFLMDDGFGGQFRIEIKKNKDGTRYAEVSTAAGKYVETIRLDHSASDPTTGQGLIFGAEMVRETASDSQPHAALAAEIKAAVSGETAEESAAIERAAGIIGDAMALWRPLFPKVRWVVAGDPANPTGGFGYDPRTGELGVNISDVLREPGNKDPRELNRRILEEWAHRVTTDLERDGKLDAQALFDALPAGLKASIRASYPAASGSWQQSHEFLRMVLQDRIEITPEGLVWRDEGGQETTESISPSLRAKLGRAIDAILGYIRDLRARLVKDGASPEVVDMLDEAIRVIRENVTANFEKQGDSESGGSHKPDQAGSTPAPATTQPSDSASPKNDNDNLQFQIPAPVSRQLLAFGRQIPDGELYRGEAGADSFGSDGYGREDDPHVTLLYGPNVQAAKIQAAARGLGPVTLELGKVSIFSGKDTPYDVVKVEVRGPELHALHERLKGIFGTASTFPDYNPHITIAYVKKGEGAKYVGDARFDGRTVEMGGFFHSDRDGKKRAITLRGEKTPAAPQSEEPANPEISEPVRKSEPTGTITIEGEAIPTAGEWAAKNPRGSEVFSGTVALVPLRLLGINTQHGQAQDRINRDQTGAAQRAEIVRNMTRENIPLAWDASNSLIEGSPIIDPSGSVIVGNNRAMALRDLFGDPSLANRARFYQHWARSRAEKLGLPVPTGGEPMVLVRVSSDQGDIGLENFVRAANKAGTQTKTAAENALSEADLATQLVGTRPDEALGEFYRLVGQPEEMRNSAGRPDEAKIRERLVNARVAALLRPAPEGAQTATQVIDGQNDRQIAGPLWGSLLGLSLTSAQLRAKDQTGVADALGRFGQKLVQNQLAEGNFEKALRRTSEQVEADLDAGSDTATAQALAEAFRGETAYVTTKAGNAKFDADLTLEGIAALLQNVRRAVEDFSTEPDMFGGSETIGEKIGRAIARHRQLKDSMLASQASARDNAAMPEENRAASPESGQPSPGGRVAKTEASDSFGTYAKYGNAISPSGNWKRFAEMPDSALVAFFHATNRPAAESILREGYNAKQSGFTDTPSGYVYLGERGPMGLGTYIGIQGKNDPVLVVFEARKGDVEPDAGTDWKSYIRNPRNRRDVEEKGSNPQSPTAVDTYAHINQVRVRKDLTRALGIVDVESGEFTPFDDLAPNGGALYSQSSEPADIHLANVALSGEASGDNRFTAAAASPAGRVNLAREYRRLFDRERAGETLTSAQRTAFEQMEQALGQQLLLDVERTVPPVRQMPLLSQPGAENIDFLSNEAPYFQRGDDAARNSLPAGNGGRAETRARGIYEEARGRGGAGGADPSGGESSRTLRIREQRARLIDAASRGEHLIPAADIAAIPLFSRRTAEHDVRRTRDERMAIKTTKPNAFGMVPVVVDDKVSLRPATPVEYLARLGLANSVFNSGQKVEGLALTEGIDEDDREVSIVTSQPWFEAADPANPNPTEDEASAYMRGLGFLPIAGRSWVRPADGVIAADARPDNFVKTPAGVHAFDLPVTQASPSEVRALLGDRFLASQPGADLSFDDEATMKYLKELTDRAMTESAGNRTVGSPWLAFSTDSAEWMGMDQLRKEEFQVQREREWDEAARRMVGNQYQAVLQGLLAKGFAGEQLNPVETKAAQLLIAQETALPRTDERRRTIQKLIYAYRETGTASARAMRARKDPHRTKAERYREFFARRLFTPPVSIQKLIDASPSQAALERRIDELTRKLDLAKGQANAHERAALERELAIARQTNSKEALLDADNAGRVKKILEKLAKNGVTEEDILGEQVELRLMGARLIKDVAGTFEERERAALRMLQQARGGLTPSQLAKRTGLSEKEVLEVNGKFREQMRRELADRFQRGVNIDELELAGTDRALFSQPTEGRERRSRDDAERMADQAMRMMGFFANNELGKIKTRRGRVKVPTPHIPNGRDLLGVNPDYAPPRTGALPLEQFPGTLPPNGGLANGANGRLFPAGPETPLPGNADFQTGPNGRLFPFSPATPLPGNPNFQTGENGRLFPSGPETPLPTNPDYTDPRTSFLPIEGEGTYREALLAMKLDPENDVDMLHLHRAMSVAEGGRWVDYANEVIFNNLLSAPITGITNLTGYAYAAYEMSIRRGVEAAINRMGKNDANAAQMGELRPMVRALTRGFSRALTNAIAAWSTESPVFTQDTLGGQVEFDANILERAHGPRIPGPAGRVVRVPSRLLLAADEAMKTLIGQSQAAAIAYRLGRQRGLTKEALERFIDAQVAGQGTPAWQIAHDDAMRLSLQTPLRTARQMHEEGEVNPLNLVIESTLKHLQDFKNAESAGGGAAKIGMEVAQLMTNLIFPFIRTPYRLLQLGLENTLPGALMKEVQSRDRVVRVGDKRVTIPRGEDAKVAARATTLTAAVVALLLAAAGEGDDDDADKPLLITGSRPPGSDEARTGLRELGYRTTPAMTIRLGGRDGIQFDYSRIDPFATMIATVVDSLRGIKETRHGRTWGDAGTNLVSSIYNQLLEKANLRGLSQLNDLATGGKSFGDYSVDTATSALIPNVIKNPLRNADPFVRDTRSMTPADKALYSAFPAEALAPPPKTDIYGRPVEKRGNALSRTFVPGQPGTQPAAPEPLDAFLARYNLLHPTQKWAPAVPPNRTDGETGEKSMTAEEYHRFLTVRGGLFKRYVNETGVVSKRLPSADDVELIKKAAAKATSDAKKAIAARTALAK